MVILIAQGKGCDGVGQWLQTDPPWYEHAAGELKNLIYQILQWYPTKSWKAKSLHQVSRVQMKDVPEDKISLVKPFKGLPVDAKVD